MDGQVQYTWGSRQGEHNRQSSETLDTSLRQVKKPSKGNVCVWDIPEKSRQICSKRVNEVTQPKQDGVSKDELPK